MYKTINELNTDQLDELRWNLFYDRSNKHDDTFESPESITDATLFFIYEGVSFTDDDFFCTAGKEVD